MTDDKKRGEELLDRIAELSQEDMRATDSDFGHIARRAGAAMAKNGEDYLAAGADLAEYLLSDRPIGKAERRELARLVLGELRKSPTKPELHPHHPDVAPVVSFLRERQAEGWPRDAAVVATAQHFGISEKTVRNREDIVVKREEAIRRARSESGLEK